MAFLAKRYWRHQTGLEIHLDSGWIPSTLNGLSILQSPDGFLTLLQKRTRAQQFPENTRTTVSR